MAANKSTSDTLAGWACDEIRAWRQVAPPAGLDAKYLQLTEERPSAFRIDLDATGARIHEKANAHWVLMDRAQRYANFIGTVARRFLLPASSILVDVDDECRDNPEFPVFSFQKTVGSKILLMPDIDFLLTDFYKHQPVDRLRFEDKSNSAIFVGSTTGGGAIDHHALDANSIPRIRLARYAKGNERVIVRLPNIVQCADGSVEIRLREEGFGGDNVSWEDQAIHRYLISIDGNGATCSRVYLALRSNSVLVKYASQCVLHYFKGMLPGREYLEIETDGDIERVFDLPVAIASSIAAEGRTFAETFLNRDALMAYAARLLLEHGEWRGAA